MKRSVFMILLLSLALGGYGELAEHARLSAQGVQTGALMGTVRSSDRLSLPGAVVTVQSPALQGDRSVVTDLNGVYVFRGLPPGVYSVTFEMDAMKRQIEKDLALPLGETVTLDVIMALATIEESVTVVADALPALTATQGGASFSARDIHLLPNGRTPFAIAELAPGLTDNTPNASQVTIGGAFAYDNVFLINGVDVNDNVLGTANNLFIEDAISQTQVLTSGISAEYGRFSGGVVNIITKTGGNLFSGSFRATLTNPAWTAETPLEKARAISRTDKLSRFYEGTLGGPVKRDRLWFFLAGRREESSNDSLFAQTGIPFTSMQENERYEVKLTGALRPGQTLQGSYTDNRSQRVEPSLPFSIDPATFTTPKLPNHLFVISYSGAFSSKLFATAQYSEKAFGVRGVGGTNTAIVESPFLSRGVLGVPPTLHYNAPYFDATDPEDRDNRQLAASLSYLLSSRRWGSHDLKGGLERFTSTRVGGNSQSATGYVFQSDYKLGADARPALDANGRLIPLFAPGVSRLQNGLPTRGAEIDITTTSLYANDRWTAGPHWAFELGVRFERVLSDATGDIVGADTSAIVPRLAASYDLGGDGQTLLQATYGHYAGKYSDVQFARNTAVGNATMVLGSYIGPAGEGRGFAPGFDPANYTIVGGSFPTANVSFEDGLSSPLTRELTFSLGRELGSRGYAKLTYSWRKATNLIEDVITMENGVSSVIRNGVTLGRFDNVIYRNSDLPERRYQGLQMASHYRINSRWQVNGHWTVQLENHGSFEGEGSNTPAVGSLAGDYPELLVPARNFPDGRLDDFQRHKIRVWSVYTLPFGRFGAMDVAPMYRYNSGRTYSLVANGVPLSAIQLSRNPGYARLPGGGSQPLFFGERGSEAFEGFALVDLALTYSLPVWKSVEPWVKVEVLNLLNNDKLISWDTSVTPDNAGPRDEHGLPINFIRGPRFGQATRNADYPRPRPGLDGGRTFLMAFGVRF